MKLKIVFTAGVYDLLHTSHLELFEEMRKQGDLTLVIIHDGHTTFANKRKFPIENLEKRTRNIIDSEMVDMVRYTYEPEPIKAFEKVIADYGKDFELIFMRGNDWLNFPGIEILQKHGIPIIYKEYGKGISSSKLRDEL